MKNLILAVFCLSSLSLIAADVNDCLSCCPTAARNGIEEAVIDWEVATSIYTQEPNNACCNLATYQEPSMVYISYYPPSRVSKCGPLECGCCRIENGVKSPYGACFRDQGLLQLCDIGCCYCALNQANSSVDEAEDEAAGPSVQAME